MRPDISQVPVLNTKEAYLLHCYPYTVMKLNVIFTYYFLTIISEPWNSLYTSNVNKPNPWATFPQGSKFHKETGSSLCYTFQNETRPQQVLNTQSQPNIKTLWAEQHSNEVQRLGSTTCQDHETTHQGGWRSIGSCHKVQERAQRRMERWEYSSMAQIYVLQRVHHLKNLQHSMQCSVSSRHIIIYTKQEKGIT